MLLMHCVSRVKNHSGSYRGESFIQRCSLFEVVYNISRVQNLMSFVERCPLFEGSSFSLGLNDNFMFPKCPFGGSAIACYYRSLLWGVHT